MIKKAELIYHPYYQAASLRLDGKEFDRPGSRLNTFLLGRSMAQWLEPFTDSYRQWGGILPELMIEVNQDDFQLIFVGLEEDYRRFLRGVEEQTSYVEEFGFRPGKCVMEHQKRFGMEEGAQVLRALSAEIRRALPTQQLFDQLAVLDEKLCGEPETFDALAARIKAFQDFLGQVLAEYDDPGHRAQYRGQNWGPSREQCRSQCQEAMLRLKELLEEVSYVREV